ncbi:restriction endonuclease subunit S [Nostoc sphaeroides CHAB 2801]|uniref:restriction endonuclease subunit S n=1 Tax=Nostoc sphaeroides TaxID=446679 RepID=UPI001E4B99E8|nr:restriction endonuclease subunit S [Nostoc sphaeroides]MCC5634220.1 restriction endonuclease subunit S [Nostoc sphaeroides CHAB 2801]
MSEWKDTEIGLLPKDSELKELGDCINLIIDHRGKTPIKLGSDWVDSGIPAISAKNIHGGRLTDKESIRYVTHEIYKKWMKEDVKKGDCFLVSEGATLGEYLYWDFDFPIVLSQRLFCIRTNPNVLYSKYFYAYMTSVNFQKQVFARATGSSVGGLRQTEVLRLKIPILPMDKQKIIGDLLYDVDRKQRLLEIQNETLEAIAQTLFKHWFIDFEFPNAHGKPYKSSGGAMIPSELGGIPEGWRVGKLGDVARVINGRAYKQTEFREEGTPIVRIQNLTGKGSTVYSDLLLDEDKYISAGDLIYAWSATFGSYIWRGAKSIYHYHIWKLDCFSKLFKYYLHIHLKRVSDSVQGQGTGSIFTHITKTLMENQELYIPDKQTMKKWDAIVNPIFDKIMTNFNQLQTLTKTRDAILPKLMSGQLRVKE